MFARLLLLPAVFWLLVPPGVCICHLPEQLLARVRGQVPPPDDHDHSQCPCCHKPDCDHPSKTPTRPHDHAGPVVPLDLPVPSLESAPVPVLEVRPVFVHPPAAGLYVQLCALRI
jgi:hypothetical protein